MLLLVLLLLLTLLAASNDAGPDRASLLEAIQYLGDTAVRYLQIATYLARPDAAGRHFDNLPPDVVGQWAPINEQAAELVHSALALVVRIGAVIVGQEWPEVGRKRGHHRHGRTIRLTNRVVLEKLWMDLSSSLIYLQRFYDYSTID